MKKPVFLLLFLLICSVSHADYFSARYNLQVPAIGGRDWNTTVSNDIISIDNVLWFVSQDSAFIDRGTSIVQRTITDNIAIGSTDTPLVKFQINGELSADAIKWSSESVASPDVTSGCPALVVSKDTDGTVRLQFYNGTSWRRITLE